MGRLPKRGTLSSQLLLWATRAYPCWGTLRNCTEHTLVFPPEGQESWGTYTSTPTSYLLKAALWKMLHLPTHFLPAVGMGRTGSSSQRKPLGKEIQVLWLEVEQVNSELVRAEVTQRGST